MGTVNVLEACIKHKIKRIMFASSLYVYNDSALFYSTSKQACESYIKNYNQLHGLKYTILRYRTLYGMRADENNSIYRIIKQALTEGLIEYNGTGEEIREYINVIDAAEASVDALEQKYENSNLILTGIERFKYKELIKLINEILDNKISIVYKPSERENHYEITPYKFKPEMAKKIISNPQVDLGQGLLLCINEIYEKTISSASLNEILLK